MDDPIVAEVRTVREQLLEQSGGSLEGLVAFLRRRERAADRHPVELDSEVSRRALGTG
ncbi:MAG: hypothetical protein IPK85_21360 [Gemmatimonadetes bacterium]|nr:hypothetical protein [Gemmatimonadota bacterium]